VAALMPMAAQPGLGRTALKETPRMLRIASSFRQTIWHDQPFLVDCLVTSNNYAIHQAHDYRMVRPALQQNPGQSRSF
jgi:hypothetical protein